MPGPKCSISYPSVCLFVLFLFKFLTKILKTILNLKFGSMFYFLLQNFDKKNYKYFLSQIYDLKNKNKIRICKHV